MASNYVVNVPKLKGRENYAEWSFAVENFLVLEGLSKCISEEITDSDAKAKAKIILTIDSSLYVHIEEEKTTVELWKKLKKLFDDSGHTRKISLLRKLMSCRLDECDSMAHYVNQIVEIGQKLSGTGLDIGDELLASIMLAGLTEKFQPMVMALENGGQKITADSIKMKLMDMTSEASGSGMALAVKRNDSYKYRNKGAIPKQYDSDTDTNDRLEKNRCDAELIAVYHGMKACFNKNLKKNFIFTDSRSALDRIKRADMSATTDFITLSIKHMLCEATTQNIQFKFAWIPGHNNIAGNEKADTLAKIGSSLNIPLDIKIDKHCFLPELKAHINNQFYQQWEQNIKISGKTYFRIHSEFPGIPWYYKTMTMDRRHISSIIRMRTGHCMTKTHLFRIGVSDSPNCECGKIETLDHLFFECPIYIIPDFDIYQEFIRIGIEAPMDMYVILKH